MLSEVWQGSVGATLAVALIVPDDHQNIFGHTKIVYQGTRKGCPYASPLYLLHHEIQNATALRRGEHKARQAEAPYKKI